MITLLVLCALASCCDICHQPMPALRPMPNMDEPIIEAPVKVMPNDKNK